MNQDLSSVGKSRRSARIYGMVFLVLAAITAIEVGLSASSLDVPRRLVTALLLLFSLGKASLVAAFYMHLRSDSRLYTYVFLLPIILLVAFAYLMVIS